MPVSCRRFDAGGFPEKVFLLCRGQASMTVRCSYHAELVRVGAEFLLKGETVLQRLTSILPLQHVILLEGGEVEIAPSQVSRNRQIRR